MGGSKNFAWVLRFGTANFDCSAALCLILIAFASKYNNKRIRSVSRQPLLYQGVHMPPISKNSMLAIKLVMATLLLNPPSILAAPPNPAAPAPANNTPVTPAQPAPTSPPALPAANPVPVPDRHAPSPAAKEAGYFRCNACEPIDATQAALLPSPAPVARTEDELINCLNDKDNPDRYTCREQGLSHKNPRVRADALSALFYGKTKLLLEVTAPPGDEKAQQELNNFSAFFANDVDWNKETRKSFYSNNSSAYGGAISGGDQLIMNFPVNHLVIDRDKKTSEEHVECRAELRLNADHTAMEGPVVCPGITGPKLKLRARLGLD